MKIVQKKFIQKMPLSLSEAWKFFSDPANLSMITPEGMRFRTTSKPAPLEGLYTGMIITYSLMPLPGIKVNWTTEISHVSEHKYFIDEQRSGPFAFFQHQHHFKEIEGGVEMTDLLSYSPPLGLLGQLVDQIFVNKKLDSIFKYRNQQIEKLFGRWSDAPN